MTKDRRLEIDPHNTAGYDSSIWEEFLAGYETPKFDPEVFKKLYEQQTKNIQKLSVTPTTAGDIDMLEKIKAVEEKIDRLSEKIDLILGKNTYLINGKFIHLPNLRG